MRERFSWGWVIPLLLIMSIIIMPRLDFDGYWYDEFYSVRNSGGGIYGPLSPWGIIQRVIETDPYQALGYPVLLAGWGALVGWTEFAARVSSWLVGLIGVAVVYRMGREILPRHAALSSLVAAMVMSVSAFFIYYSHELRTFTLVALLAATLIWSYWRISYADTTSDDAPPRWVQAGFVLSGVGLLWSHYYTVMLLVGLALYHLLRLLWEHESRHWWRLVGLALVVSVLFLPQVPGFLGGYSRFETEKLGQPPLSAMGVLQTLLYYGGNGTGILTLGLMVAGTIYAWLDERRHLLRLVIIVTMLSTGVLVTANEILGMIEPSRIRYAIYLLPLLALWLAAGMVAVGQWIAQRLPAKQHRWRFAVMLLIPALWLANGIVVNSDPDFTNSIEHAPTPRLRSLVTAMEGHEGETDLLAFYSGSSETAFFLRNIVDLALTNIDVMPLFTANLYLDGTRNWAQNQVAEADRVWYAVNRLIEINSYHRRFTDTLNAEFVRCADYIDDTDIALSLWVRDAAFCPTDEPRITYDERFALTGASLQSDAEMLTVQLGWAVGDMVPPDTYSLGVYLTDADDPDTILAQNDIGLSAADFVPVTTRFDLSNMNAGDYAVRVVVYEWRTGDRLTGTTQTGETGSYLPIETFPVNE